MKLKQSKTRTPAGRIKSASRKSIKSVTGPVKTTGIGATIAELAAKKRGVTDWHARQSGSRAL